MSSHRSDWGTLMRVQPEPLTPQLVGTCPFPCIALHCGSARRVVKLHQFLSCTARHGLVWHTLHCTEPYRPYCTVRAIVCQYRKFARTVRVLQRNLARLCKEGRSALVAASTTCTMWCAMPTMPGGSLPTSNVVCCVQSARKTGGQNCFMLCADVCRVHQPLRQCLGWVLLHAGRLNEAAAVYAEVRQYI